MKISAFNIPNEKTVTCIIPMRIGKDRLDAIDRLEFFLYDTEIPKTIGFIVIDDGSDQEESKKIKEKCVDLNVGFVRIESILREFSIGRCRNVGAMYATSQYILMQDVDLMPWPGFYNHIIDEIEIQELGRDIKKFLMIPYVFLTEIGTKEFINTEPRVRSKKFLHYALLNDKKYIEKVSTGTSANLYNRLWYLSRGGNSEDFEGWGYEDLECNTRMVRHHNFFPVPDRWRLQKYNFNSVLKYESWKSSYRLYGDLLFNKGVALFHAWHPVSAGGTYMQRREFNRKLFEKKMIDFVLKRIEPEALPDLSRGKSLLIRRNAFTFSRTVQPLLGEVVAPTEDLLEGEVGVKEYLQKHNISRIVFHNPYLDQRVFRLYEETRRIGCQYIVCERGALPNSCFFDSSGFLVDGKTYIPEKWDREPSESNKEAVLEYIKTLHNSDEALEDQPTRMGKEGTRRKLNLKSKVKVLFVPFQRPGDTVTRYFTGELGNYENFVEMVRELSYLLPENWTLVAKKHPLEDEDFKLSDNVVYANSSHIKDLLDVSDAVLTFNSGVGVLSMAWGVPTMLAGNAYYQHDDINSEVRNIEQVLQFLGHPKIPRHDKVVRFYSYLIHEVYSFGVFSEKKVRMPDGSRMTATVDINLYKINWPGEKTIFISDNRKPEVSWESFLFDRYRFAKECESQMVIQNISSRESLWELSKKGVKKVLRKIKKIPKKAKQLFRHPRHEQHVNS